MNRTPPTTREPDQAVPHDGPRQPSRLVCAVKEQAAKKLSDRKHRAAAELAGFGTAVQGLATDLDEHGHPSMARYATQAATHLAHLAARLDGVDLDRSRLALEAYARRQPALFIGAALGAGVVVGHILSDVVEAASGDDAPAMPAGRGGLETAIRSHPLRAGVWACVAGVLIGLTVMASADRSDSPVLVSGA
jgi:hypothetical protein